MSNRLVGGMVSNGSSGMNGGLSNNYGGAILNSEMKERFKRPMQNL